MITPDFVIIPLEVQGIVPYGVGSVRIDRYGRMEFIAPSGEFFGREIEHDVRLGLVRALRLTVVREPAEQKETRPGEDK